MRNKTFFIVATILIGFILSYLYAQVVIPHPQEKFKEFRKTVYLKGETVREDFQLPKDAYLLKIKHTIQVNQPKEIFLNGFQITPDIFPYIRKRGVIETSYIRLPEEIVKEGKNYIEINFPKNRPPDVDIILSNYRKQIDNGIYILFFDSASFSSGNISFKTTLLAVVIVFLVFGVMIHFLSKIFYLSINRFFLYQIYSMLPFIMFLSSIWMVSNLSRTYKVVVTPGYFWTFGLVSFFITESCIVLKKIWQGYKRKEVINPQAAKPVFIAFAWIKSREFADKCILLFMVLLIMCAFLLILHLEPVAEQLANLAYFALVVGVVIKFVKFVKEERS